MNPKTKKTLFLILGTVAAGIALGMYLALGNPSFNLFEQFSLGEIYGGLFLFVIGIQVITAIHELGHLTMGKILGYRFGQLRVGRLVVTRVNTQLKLSLIKNQGYGGLCAMFPSEGSTLKAYALFASGGILANALSGTLLLFSASWGGLSPVLRFSLQLTGVFSLVFGLLNAFPYRSMNQPTDGLVVWSILGDKPLAKDLYAMQLVSSQLMAGIRPREMTIPSEDPEKAFNAQGASLMLYRYFQHMDREEILEAGKVLQVLREHLEELPPFTLPAFYYELIFYALLTQDLEEARKYYALAGKILQTDQDINGLRVKAYYAALEEQDREKARAFAREGLQVEQHFPLAGQGIFEGDLLRQLLQRLDEDSSRS